MIIIIDLNDNKKVNSGDCVTIRSLVVKDGKNLEKQVMLSNITAPRLGRNNRDNQEEKDAVRRFSFLSDF